MLRRILPARGVFAGARAAAACRARRAHTQASGAASDQAVTIQKMSTDQWAEAFKKVCTPQPRGRKRVWARVAAAPPHRLGGMWRVRAEERDRTWGAL